ncbi:MAG: GGGtGRT protein [Eubacterium sp.]
MQERMYRTGKKYFSVASGGGTGRTLHPDNTVAGPASYGRQRYFRTYHSDAQSQVHHQFRLKLK